MKTFHSILLFLALAWSGTVSAAELAHREWTIEGTNREALIYIPPGAAKKATPVVFAFHGHGGNSRNAAQMFPIGDLWPEAIVVYMQGINTPGRLTDLEGKKPGWQINIGDHGDRDLKFFDAVLASLKKDYKVNKDQIYSTGHSNGGAFTYLLWAARGDVFAAVGPSASIAVPPLIPLLKSKPVFHVAGETDPLVKFEWQERMMDHLKKLNRTVEAQPNWQKAKLCTLYPSNIGAPLIAYVHPGGHTCPPEAVRLMVKFFQAQRQD